MRLISWQRLGIIASVVWVVVGPSYFHLSREDNDRRIAGDRYQLCIKQAWAKNRRPMSALGQKRTLHSSDLFAKADIHAWAAGRIYEYAP